MRALLAGMITAMMVAGAHAGNVEQGKQVFDRWCAHCHAAEGRMAGTIALEARYQGSKPAALEQRIDLTDSVIRVFVRNGISVMAPFRKTEISDADLASLVVYLTRNNARANSYPD